MINDVQPYPFFHCNINYGEDVLKGKQREDVRHFICFHELSFVVYRKETRSEGVSTHPLVIPTSLSSTFLL